jgi:hypothetical protein
MEFTDNELLAQRAASVADFERENDRLSDRLTEVEEELAQVKSDRDDLQYIIDRVQDLSYDLVRVLP